MGKQGNRSGRSGPPKLPDRIKVLRGGAGEDEIKWPLGTPEMPAELTGEAAAEWGRLVAELEPRGVLSPLDRSALMALCQQWALYQEAREVIEREGHFYQSPNGRKFLNPWTTIAKDALKSWSGLMLEFGLSPASRARLRIPAAPTATDPKTARFFPNLGKERK